MIPSMKIQVLVSICLFSGYRGLSLSSKTISRRKQFLANIDIMEDTSKWENSSGLRHISNYHEQWLNETHLPDSPLLEDLPCEDQLAGCVNITKHNLCKRSHLVFRKCRQTCTGCDPSCYDAGFHCDIIHAYGVCGPEFNIKCQKTCGYCNQTLIEDQKQGTTIDTIFVVIRPDLPCTPAMEAVMSKTFNDTKDLLENEIGDDLKDSLGDYFLNFVIKSIKCVAAILRTNTAIQVFSTVSVEKDTPFKDVASAVFGVNITGINRNQSQILTFGEDDPDDIPTTPRPGENEVPVEPRPPIDPGQLNSASEEEASDSQFSHELKFCCDTNLPFYNTSSCSGVTCNDPLDGDRFKICREGDVSIDAFFTTSECHACVCYEGFNGIPYANCHTTICPGASSYKPHYQCLTLTKDQGDLGCCIEYFCDNTTCKTDFGAYLGIGEERQDPGDPCTTCSCSKGESEDSTPVTICITEDCPESPGPECRPIKYVQECCPREWDCTNSYLMVTPKGWAAGEVGDVCIFTPSGDNASLTVQIDDKGYNIEQTLLLSGVDIYCASIEIPQEVPTGSYILSISGEVGDLNISETRNIRVVNIVKTWVQTDKFLYLPGQLVQFRILTVTGKQLKVLYDEIPSIYITSPSGSRMVQWSNVNNAQGIVHLNYSLPEEPEEGAYTIQVETNNSATQQVFKVEPYVLPRFTVTITALQYILATDTEAKFSICAEYTFGESVKGYLTYNARPRYFYRPPPILLENVDDEVLEINGCQEVTITPDDIGSKVTLFTLEATVEEQGTGVAVSAQINVQVHRSQLKFTKISKEEYYKPGLPLSLQVLVSAPDDSPVVDLELNVCIMDSICSKLSTDEDGILTAVIPSNVADTNSQITVTVMCESCFNYTAEVGFYYPGDSSVSYYFQKFFSPSESFMSVKSTIQGDDCENGRDVVVGIEYVAEASSEAKVWIVLISSGRIISTTHHQVEFESSSLSVDESQVIGGGLGDVGSSHVRGTTSMTVPLPTTASNILKILVWYARTDGEVVAASTSVKVPACQRNPTTLSWSPDQPQEPGQLVTVNLTAVSQSICSLGVVDKSVEELSKAQGGSQLTLAALTDLLQELEPPSWYTQSDDTFYCTGKDSFFGPIGINFRKRREAEGNQRENNMKANWSNGKKSAELKSFFPGPGAYTKEKDSITAFDDAGVYVLSDLTVETRPCINSQFDIFDDVFEAVNPILVDGPPVPGVAVEGAEADFNVASSPDTAKTDQEVDEPREYFPETWLWKILLVPDSGFYEEDLELPDTITEWVGEGICVHPEAGLGISNIASTVTFTPFFLDLTVPPTIKQGETVPLKISVFNYLEDKIPVSVELSGSGSYSIESGTGQYSLCIDPESKEVNTLMIKPLEAGSVNLTVSAYIDPENQELCGDNVASTRRDTVIREIKVKWEGVEKQVVKSGYLCDGADAEWQFTVPDNIVAGSARGFIYVAADLMGPTIENLDHLVRMPTGCGEQNMLGFTPNIFVRKYLSAAGLETPDIVRRTTQNMEAGYRRELEYRHDDGSYSAFGKRDESGSTWLTAFVLKSFAQARSFITVDEQDLTLSKDWLESLQREDGCFDLVGTVLHKEMKGGLGDSDQLAPLTSYVIISLLEAELNTSDDIIDNATSCINSATQKTFYTEALRAYALALYDDEDTEAALNSAIELVKIEEDEPSGSNSILVEAIAYVLLAMLNYKPDDYVAQIAEQVRVITKYSNGEGGFVSTQDTVVALQALAEYATKFQSSEGSGLDVEVTKGDDTWNFNVDQSNRLLVQMETLDVPDSESEYEMSVTTTGEGCALISSILRYNVPYFGEVDVFTATVESTASDNCKSDIQACASYNLADGESNMAIMKFDLTTGFTPIIETLKTLLERNIIKKYEYEEDGNRIVLYFYKIEATETCVKFKVNRELPVTDPKDTTFTVSDYYDDQFTLSKNFEITTGSGCSESEP